MRLINNPKVDTNTMTKNWAREILEGYKKYPAEFKKLKNAPHREWMRLLDSSEVGHDAQVWDDMDINMGGGSCYLPTILAST